MFELLAAKIAESVLLGKLKAIKVPAWIYWVLAGILLSIGLAVWHHFLVQNFKSKVQLEQKQADDKAWTQKLEIVKQDALTWKNKYEMSSTALTDKNRASNEEALRHSNSLADSLRSQGPGAARCRSVSAPSIPQSSSEHEQTSGTGPTDVVPVHNQGGTDLIALPYNDLITVGQFCSANKLEVETWRTDHSQQENLYNQLRNTSPSGK